MLKLKKVAVTGGISCGKTQFCSCLLELGAHVVSADNIVHQLLSPETNLGKKVIELLGPNVIVHNKIDRTKIAERVFDNPQLLYALERIIHPEVFETIEEEYIQTQKHKGISLFVAEIPLLFEVGGEKFFDKTVAVISDEALCIERFHKATGKEPSEYHKRMARQLPQSEKASKADYVVTNNSTLAELRLKAKQLYEELAEE